MNSTITTSPAGEPQPDGLLTIPVGIKLHPASDVLGAQEIDLVLSVLDDIVQEMKRLESELDSDAGAAQSDQHLPIINCNCC